MLCFRSFQYTLYGRQSGGYYWVIGWGEMVISSSTDGGRFELPVPSCGTHTFQACTISHSVTHPHSTCMTSYGGFKRTLRKIAILFSFLQAKGAMNKISSSCSKIFSNNYSNLNFGCRNHLNVNTTPTKALKKFSGNS